MYFLDITRAGAPFTSVSTTGNGNFLFSIDDIVVEEADTNDDGLEDGDEVDRGTDPLESDTDGDGLSLERLCPYITRPPIATKRLSVDGRGRVEYQYKHPFRDGTR